MDEGALAGLAIGLGLVVVGALLTRFSVLAHRGDRPWVRTRVLKHRAAFAAGIVHGPGMSALGAAITLFVVTGGGGGAVGTLAALLGVLGVALLLGGTLWQLAVALLRDRGLPRAFHRVDRLPRPDELSGASRRPAGDRRG